ncbi:U32 family peptidase [Candidatus Pacearchaeota archaeon]|nr:U32 family peptidase [Candidatus Pacearchaeota archaeon]
MKQEYELLAPVGNFRNLYAAIEAGCDAVYFGIRGFNMRATAKNFTLRDLPRIRKICNESKRKVKMYLTLNTVMYEEDQEKLERIIKGICGKVDAVICVDMSVIGLCKKYKIPFHISTQASISNLASAKFYKKLGAERVVLARELNLKQIKKISKSIEVECFIHGAMCVAVSGRCFMSEYSQGLSANKGQCAQLCRRSWNIKDDAGNELKLENNRVMSAKDLCTLPFIEKMKEAGITSFKIEGRNRSAEYVYTVVSEYRKALDKKLTREEIVQGIANLKKVYNRGFSSGFYLKMPTADDFSFSEHGDQEERKEFVGKIYKYWPRAKVCSLKMNSGKLKVGEEVYLISNNAPIKRVKVKSIQLEGRDVKSIKKGDDVGIDFGVRALNGTEVYKINKV